MSTEPTSAPPPIESVNYQKARVELAIEALLARHGERIDGRRRAAIWSVLHSQLDDSVAWTTQLNLLLNTLGYASDVVSYAPSQWRELIDEPYPLLTCVTVHGERSWFVFTPEQQGALLTHARARQRDYKIYSGSELLTSLGLDQDAPIDWLRVSPALPLESLRISPDDPRDKPAKALARLRSILRLERDAIGYVLVFSIVVGLLSLLTPLAVQTIVNTLSFGMLLQPILILTVVVLLGLSLSGLLRVFQSIVVEFMQRRIFARAVMDTTNRLIRMDASANDRRYAPELVNRFFDVMTIQKAASSLLLDGLSLALQTIIGLIVLAFYHPLLLAFDIVLIVFLSFIIFVLGKKAIKTSLIESNAKYSVAAWMEDIARYQNLFKPASGMDMAVKRAEALTHDYLESRNTHYRIVLRQIIGVVSLQAFASATVLGLGGYLVLQGQLTLGQLVAAELIVTLIVDSMSKFGKHFETFYDMSAGVYKLGELVDLPLEPSMGEVLRASPDEKGLEIKLLSTSFSFGKGAILKDASLTIEAGKRVCLTAGRAQGKSTILELIYGLRTPSAGHILIGGVELSQLSLPSTRDQIMFISDLEIVTGSVEENLRMGHWGADRAELRQILEHIGLGSCIRKLPDGLDTELTTGGAPLSRSQALLLVIARALVKRPRLLLIDGVLDELDVPSRQVIWKALKELGATVVVATYEADLFKNCDLVLGLEGGQFKEVSP